MQKLLSNINKKVKLSEAQTEILISALTLVSRLGTGGLTVIHELYECEYLPLKGGGGSRQRMLKSFFLKSALKGLKEVLYLDERHVYGINHPKVSSLTKSAWVILESLDQVNYLNPDWVDPSISRISVLPKEYSVPVLSMNKTGIEMTVNSFELDSILSSLNLYSKVLSGDMSVLLELIKNEEIPTESPLSKELDHEIRLKLTQIKSVIGGTESPLLKTGDLPLLSDLISELSQV